MCPNIMASRYAQIKLRDILGYTIINEIGPFTSQSFTVVFPPLEYKNDKPVICSDDGKSKIEEYVPLMKALKVLKVLDSMDTVKLT